MSENPFEILRDWAQEPENIETIAQAVQALQRSVTQLTATLSSVVTVNPSGSSASSGASSSGTLTPMPTNLGDIWIVGPNPTDQTIVLRYAGEPDEPITLSTTLQTFLVGMLVLFINGPAAGYPTVVTDVASDGTITVEPLDHTPNPGNRFVFLSSFAATSGSQYNPNHQGTLPPSGNNTVTIPSGVTVNLDVSGQFANNTITILENGTGLITTLNAANMLGSSITLMEGDTLDVATMINSNVISTNSAGGVNINLYEEYVPGGFNSGYYIFNLQAGSAGTLTLSAGLVFNYGQWSYQLDNNAESAYMGQSVVYFDLTPGEHTLTLRYNPSEFGASMTGDGQTIDFSNYSTGPIVSGWNGVSQGAISFLGHPSSIRLGNMLNSGINVYGDTITVANEEVSNSQIVNEVGEAASNSTVEVTGSMTEGQINYGSQINLEIGNLRNAEIIVPVGIDVVTVIYFTGLITESLTTTAAQTTYVGTDLIPNYVAPSSDPASVISAIVHPADVLYVPDGNVSAYTAVTDNGFIKVAGRLITDTIAIGAGAQLVVDVGGQVELGAFS